MNPRIFAVFFIFLLMFVSVNATVIDDFEHNDLFNNGWKDIDVTGTRETQGGTVYEGSFAYHGASNSKIGLDGYDFVTDENYCFYVYTDAEGNGGAIWGLMDVSRNYLTVIRPQGSPVKYQVFNGSSYTQMDTPAGVNTGVDSRTDDFYKWCFSNNSDNTGDVYLWDLNGELMGWEHVTPSSSADVNSILIFAGSLSGNTYVDYIHDEVAPASSVTASFNSLENKHLGLLQLTDTSTAVNTTINDWNWYIDSVKQSDDQNFNYTITESQDYNVCLWVEDVNNLYNDFTCSTISSSDWKPLINWEEINGSWLQGTTTLDFNLLAVGTATTGLKIYYGLGAYDFNHLIVNDTNIFNATGVVCDDYNFQDNTSCSYSFNSSTIADGNYFFDLNIYNTWGDENDTVNLLADNTAPVLTFDLNFTSGFTDALDINFFLNCNDALSPTDRYLLYINDINVNDTTETNDTNLDVTSAILNGNNDTNAFCYDEAGNFANDVNTSVVYALWFNLINEDTGGQITNLLTDVNVLEASVYTYDGNVDYDLNGLFPKWFVGSTQVLRFDFTYNDDIQTEISREMDFSLLTDQNANVCVAPFQTLYEQIFVSSTERPVVVYNDYAKCYNLASYTKFAYENALMVKGYTINKPYYLYTWSNGVKILLALIEGSTPSIMNLDTLIFNRAEYTIDIATDTVGIAPKLNTVTGEYDTNTIEIYYKSLRGTNDSLTFKVYNDTNLLWTYTETTNPNEILVEFYYYSMDINSDNLLTLQVTKTVDGENTTSEYYFYIDGSSYAGTLNPILAIIVAFILMFVAITFVAYRYALGWFGILIGIIAIGVLSMSPGFWYIRFAQAIILIIIVFIVLIFKNETAGLN